MTAKIVDGRCLPGGNPQKSKILVVNLSNEQTDSIKEILVTSKIPFDLSTCLNSSEVLAKACSDIYDAIFFASANKQMRQHIDVVAQLNHIAPFMQTVLLADQNSLNLLREKLGDMAFHIIAHGSCPVQVALILNKAVEQTRRLRLENVLQRKFYIARGGHTRILSLQKSLYKLASSFNVLREFIESMGSTQQLPTMLGKVLSSIQGIFGCSKAVVLLHNSQSGCFEPAQGIGLNQQIQPLLRFRSGEGLAGWCAANRKTLILNDVMKDPRYKSFGSIREDRMCFMGAPLVAGSRTHGVLCMESPYYKNNYNAYDLALFEILSAQVAITLENMLVIDDIRSVNQNLGEKIAELNALFDINEATIKFIDQDKVLAQVAERTARALKVDRCSILLTDPESKNLVLTAGHGVKPSLIGSLRLAPGKSISGMVSRFKKPILVNDLDGKPDFKKLNLEPYLCGDLIAVPLRGELAVLGVISVSGKQQGKGFTNRNRDLMVSIADTVSKAISNHYKVVEMMTKEREKVQIEDRFKQYVAPSVVAQVVNSSDLLECRRKEVTILMSDVSNFTPISENIEAETIVTMLNEYFNMMTDVVFSEKGTIDKFIGDAVFAIFGAPVFFPDHAERAVRSAITMLRMFQSFKEEWIARDARFAPMGLKVAIGTGQALVGNIGSRRRMEYTSFGEATSVCEQLEDIAKMDHILLDEKALEQLGGRVKAEKLEGKTVETTSGIRQVYNVNWRETTGFVDGSAS